MGKGVAIDENPQTTDAWAAVDLEVAAPPQLVVGTLEWCPATDERAVSIAVKATFRLEPHHSPLSDEPEPWRDAEVDGWPTDAVPFKRSPELFVVGHVRGTTARTKLAARISFGAVEKRFEAWAARAFDEKGTAVVVGPLVREVPLRYELTAGGPGTENPIGVAPSPTAVPSLVPARWVPRPSMPIPVVGTGPIASDWPARARRVRAEDRLWIDTPAHTPIPDGFDAAYFSSAPQDQRLEAPPSSAERLVLEGLHPEYATLTTHLAPIAPTILIDDGDVAAPELVADTLVIDADRGIATITYRAVLRGSRALFDKPLRLRVALAEPVDEDHPITVVPPAPAQRDALIDLVGFDLEVPGRLRRSRAMAQLLEPVPVGSPPKLDVLRVLSAGTPVDLERLRTLNVASEELELPLAVVMGELTVRLDDLEALKLAIAVASRLSSSDRQLRGAIELAERVVDSPMPLSSEGAAALLSQLYRATDNLPFPPGFVESQVTRGLREQRRYRRRNVLGASHVRAELALEGGVVPLYLSEAIAERLPLAPSCQVVALVEVRPGEDLGELADEALVALGLGRVIRATSTREVAA